MSDAPNDTTPDPIKEHDYLLQEITCLSKDGRMVRWHTVNFGGSEIERQLVEQFGGTHDPEFGYTFIIGAVDKVLN